MDNSRDLLMCYLRLTQHMSQQLRDYFGKLNLTFPQALLLTVLAENGPMPISDLAEQTRSANSTVSGIVDRLEKLDLAKRERSETDRRVIYVTVTDKYRKLYQKAEAQVSGHFTALLDGIPPADQAEIYTALDKLDTYLSQRNQEEILP